MTTYWSQSTHRDHLSGPALCHGSLNPHFPGSLTSIFLIPVVLQHRVSALLAAFDGGCLACAVHFWRVSGTIHFWCVSGTNLAHTPPEAAEVGPTGTFTLQVAVAHILGMLSPIPCRMTRVTLVILHGMGDNISWWDNIPRHIRCRANREHLEGFKVFCVTATTTWKPTAQKPYIATRLELGRWI